MALSFENKLPTWILRPDIPVTCLRFTSESLKWAGFHIELSRFLLRTSLLNLSLRLQISINARHLGTVSICILLKQNLHWSILHKNPTVSPLPIGWSPSGMTQGRLIAVSEYPFPQFKNDLWVPFCYNSNTKTHPTEFVSLFSLLAFQFTMFILPGRFPRPDSNPNPSLLYSNVKWWQATVLVSIG